MPQFRIPCLIVRQRPSEAAPRFAIFAAAAGEITTWAAIKRRTEHEQGTQRPLNQAKLSAVDKFLQKDDRNTIPPAITITLRVDDVAIHPIDEGNKMYVITLDVPDGAGEDEKPGLVIDGQHRLFGILAHNPTFLLNVVALLNADDLETAFQFLVINNKVTPVQPDLIRTLALDYQEHDLAERLRTARLNLHPNLSYVRIIDTDDDSPFRGLAKLVTTDPPEQRFVTPAAIENAIAVIQKKEVPELKSVDAVCEFFYGMWSPLKQDQWAPLWNAESKLMSKAGIVAMTTYVADALIARYDFAGDLDVSDREKVEEQTRLILQNQTPEFWTSEWNLKISDTAIVREKIVESLTRVYRNMRSDKPWHEDLELVAL